MSSTNNTNTNDTTLKNTHISSRIKEEPFKPKLVYLVIIWTSISFIAVAGLFFFASLIAFNMLV